VNAVNSDYLLTVCCVGQTLGVRYRERTRELANSAAVHVTRDRLRNGGATVVDGRSRAEGSVQLIVGSLTQVSGQLSVVLNAADRNRCRSKTDRTGLVFHQHFQPAVVNVTFFVGNFKSYQYRTQIATVQQQLVLVVRVRGAARRCR
jgi:hypothetical protein